MIADGARASAEARERVVAGQRLHDPHPGPRGQRRFPPSSISHATSSRWPRARARPRGLPRPAAARPGRRRESFCMTVLALRTSGVANGVARLHGERLARRCGEPSGRSSRSTRCRSPAITNGVHPPTWLSREMRELFDRYLGPRLARASPTDPASGSASTAIPDDELWRVHERAASAWSLFARERLRAQCGAPRRAPAGEPRRPRTRFDPDALTIGFARRFATYKRATLLLRDPERLARAPQRREAAGAARLRRQGPPRRRRRQGAASASIVRASQRPQLRDRIVFLEDYDMRRRALPRAGRRRLAQHAHAARSRPAAPAG